jgi:hypothetical protein
MALNFSVPDTELSLNLHNRRDQVIDQVFQGTPFFRALSTHGGIRMESGGQEITTPLRMSKNSTTSSFSSFDILDTTPQDNETSMRLPWSFDAATVSIAWTETLKNAGRGKLIDVVRQKTEDAMMSLRDKLNVQLLQTQPSAGSKDPISITEVIDNAPSADPPRVASIGSIGNANTWWRNVATSGGAFTIADVNTLYNDVSDGHDFPSFLLTSQTVYEYYENSLTDLIRYGDSRSGDQGFTELLFKRTPIIWDPQIGITDEIYFINTKYFQLVIHSDGDFVTTDFVEPDNQAAKVAKILWAGNLEATNRRRLGTLYAITAPV